MRWLAASVMLIFLLTDLSAAPLDTDAYPAPGSQIWVGQHRLHIYCIGEGAPAVVLDAGLGGSSLDWTKVQPEVAKFTRVCSYDRAGYGWSDQGPKPRTADIIAAELERLLKEGGIAAPYVLVGHSFGALGVRLFASRFPERIAGLVLIDATHEAQFERFEAAQISTLAPANNRRFVIANHYQIPAGLPAAVKPIAQALALGPSAIDALYDELRNMRLSAHQVSLLSTLPNVPLIVLAHDGRAIAHSERARRMAEIWLDLQQDLASRTPQGQFVVTANSGHYIHLDQPNIVIDAIRKVVETSRANRCGEQLPQLLSC